MNIKILQINVGRAYAAQDMAHATAKEKGADILIVGEPNKKRVQGSEWLKDSRTNVAAKVLTKNPRVLNHEIGDGYLILTLTEYSLVCCYISPNLPEQDYNNEVDVIMRKIDGREAIVLGDINAKSSQWGSPRTDRKGEYWECCLATRDMVVHNTGIMPTFIRGDTKSYIDVTISTTGIARRIKKWEVLETETLTEHQYIFFEIEGVLARRKKHNTKAIIDWRAFKDTVELTQGEMTDTTHESCTRIIKQACKNSTTHRRYDVSTIYWWNDSIARKRAECNKARRKMTRSAGASQGNREDTDRNRERYKALKRDLNKLIREAKKKCWKDLCCELDDNIWGTAYKIVMKKLNILTPYEIDDEIKIQIVNELFPRAIDDWEIEPVEKDIQPFTLEELKVAVASIKCGKAPGLDQIPPEAVKIVAECLPNWLLGIMNNILTNQEFPMEWKEAKVVLIPKKSDRLPMTSTSFRPLCMLSVLSKLLEVLIKNRLQEELGRKGGLHPSQFSYQKGKSTIQAIEEAIETVREYNSKWCALVAIDVKNAFNTASHSTIISKLRERKMSKYLINIISSYLRHRKIKITNEHSIEANAGVPQGSVLGPILWNILYDDVLSLELSKDSKCIAFADDLALIVGAQTDNNLIERVNESLERISAWMGEHRLALAPQKTEAIILGGKRNTEEIRFRLEGVTITPTKTIKYLGITLDEKLSFRAHLQRVTTKAENRIASLRRILPNIGGPGSAKRSVLSSALHNIILYGAPVWMDVIEKKKYRQILEKTQRKILLRAAQAYRTVSGLALQVITGTIPVDLLVRERAHTYHHRQEQMREVKERARNNTMRTWQERWANQTQKAQWTKRIIPDVTDWMKCEHRTGDYYLTQVLSGHGAFRHFAKRIGKDTTDECMYCREQDTVEHTIFNCARWREERDRAYGELQEELTPETLAATMTTSDSAWKIVHNMIRRIMSAKEKEELERQKRERRVI